MILTEDLRVAFGTEKIIDLDRDVIYDQIFEAITEYALRFAQSGINDGFVEKTTDLFCDDVIKYHKHLHVGEVVLAIKLLGQGVIGEMKHVSVNLFTDALGRYINSNERAKFKEQLIRDLNQKQLPEKATQWTDEKHAEVMRDRYIENLNLVDKGKPVRDLGGLLFKHMIEKGIIEMTIEDENEVVEALRERRKEDPLNKNIRDLVIGYEKGEDKLLPLIQEHVLTKYFKIEVAMRLEAKKIKAQQEELLNKMAS